MVRMMTPTGMDFPICGNINLGWKPTEDHEEITSGGTSIRNSNILVFSDKSLGLYLDESIDDDNDSLPDRYEIKSFGDLSESATGDFDGDGFSNLLEYHFGMEANRSDEVVVGGTSIRDSNLISITNISTQRFGWGWSS